MFANHGLVLAPLLTMSAFVVSLWALTFEMLMQVALKKCIGAVVATENLSKHTLSYNVLFQLVKFPYPHAPLSPIVTRKLQSLDTTVADVVGESTELLFQHVGQVPLFEPCIPSLCSRAYHNTVFVVDPRQ